MAKDKKKRARGRVEQNAFVKGLITEASPLTFPENASLAEENFVLNRDGSRQRRLGMDFEIGAETTEVDNLFSSLETAESYTWKDASNNKSFDIAVVKIADDLYFFDGNAEVVSASPINLGEKVTIPRPLDAEGNPIIAGAYDFAVVNGLLLVVNNTNLVYILEFDIEAHLAGLESVTLNAARIKVRDLFGIDEPNVADDFRDITLSEIHEYNLRNQGWVPDLQCSYKGEKLSIGLVDTIAYTFKSLDGDLTQTGVYPSNADMVWANKVSGDATLPEAIGAYDPFELVKSTYNNQEAPKGRYIIDLFERGASREAISKSEGVIVPPFESAEETVGGVTAVTSYMGRAVYAATEVIVNNADDESPALGNMIYFSQAKDSKNALTKCHTVLDPTAGEDFAALATDGGFLPISGLGQVNSLEVQGNSLYVFSDRGVWQINGGDRLFTMTNIHINKISNVGSLGRNSVTAAEDQLFYLSDGGIYVITGISATEKAQVENITQSTIQGFYDDLEAFTKVKSTSYYDRYTRQIKWLFAIDKVANTSYYDTELIFDLNLAAFFVHRIKSKDFGLGTPFILGYLERPSLVSAFLEENVTVNGDIVHIYENTLPQENVTIARRNVDNAIDSSNKYWCIFNTLGRGRLTVSEYNQLHFIDWASVEESALDAEAFLLTGSSTAGDSATFKRIPYITTHMRRTEDNLFEIKDGFVADNTSSCSLQAQWEWVDDPEAGRWSNPQEVYRLPRTFVPDSPEFPYGHTVVTTKNRLRGKGRAFSLLFKTKPLHDCHLYGWSIELDAEVSV